jgi:pimeloyl-ACP methyl ester carboxylesterase
LPAQPESPPAESLAGHFGVRELRLPAKASELGRAREYANQAAATFGFGAEDRFEFVFAVNEAVTNAIMHGAADEVADAQFHSERLHRDVPRATFELVPETGHMIHHIRPLEVMETVRKVIARSVLRSA